MTQATATHASMIPLRTLRLRLGVFDLAVQSVLPEALDDLAYLYRDRLIGTNGNEERVVGERSGRIQPTIEIRAVRQARRWSLERRYTIVADGQELFTGRRMCEVLAYMEWAANWRIIAAHHQYLQIHGASLSRDGRGLILVGPSGAGKTTLAAALMARGWGYFCDEFALIEPGTGRLQPFPKALCIKSGSFEVVESLGLRLYRPRAYVKAFKGPVAYVSPADGRGAEPAEPCPIHDVCFVRYTGTDRPALRPIGDAEALIELSRQAFNRATLGERGFQTLATLVRRARCYQLESGAVEPTCRAVETMMNR